MAGTAAWFSLLLMRDEDIWCLLWCHRWCGKPWAGSVAPCILPEAMTVGRSVCGGAALRTIMLPCQVSLCALCPLHSSRLIQAHQPAVRKETRKSSHKMGRTSTSHLVTCHAITQWSHRASSMRGWLDRHEGMRMSITFRGGIAPVSRSWGGGSRRPHFGNR